LTICSYNIVCIGYVRACVRACVRVCVCVCFKKYKLKKKILILRFFIE